MRAQRVRKILCAFFTIKNYITVKLIHTRAHMHVGVVLNSVANKFIICNNNRMQIEIHTCTAKWWAPLAPPLSTPLRTHLSTCSTEHFPYTDF